jgi:hypothetical protein
MRINEKCIGRCGICGGSVTVPTIFWSVVPPTPQCEQCGALYDGTAHLPVLPMIPASPNGKTWEDVIEEKRERMNKGEKAYAMRKSGRMKWKEIASVIESDQPNAMHLAHHFAKSNELEWPIKVSKILN